MATDTQAPAVPAEYITFADRLADAAGQVIRRYFRTPVPIDIKADHSPVTAADRGAEEVMRGLINAEFPDHGIFGEEFGNERVDADWVWYLDPVDGTKSFITGSAQFGTLIGLAYQGRPVLGVIDQPIQGERWLGVAGRVTTFNGREIASRHCDDLSRAVLYSWGAEIYDGENGPAMRRVTDQVYMARYSADCYAYGLLSMGFVDLVIEDGLKPYDYMALAPVVNGAGGLMTDWDGNEIVAGCSDRVIAAGDRQLHAKVRELLSE